MNCRAHITQYLEKKVHVEVDRPIGYRHGTIVYPINYGYLPGIPGGDGEEQDTYILGVNTPVKEFDGRVIAVILRSDDVEDKLVVAPNGSTYSKNQIAEAVQFQEQYFNSCILTSDEQPITLK